MTDKGLIEIGELVGRAVQGESLAIYTHDVTDRIDAQARFVATRPVRSMVAGSNEIVALRFSDGSIIRCTWNQRVWTENRGWVDAASLRGEDRVVKSIQYSPRTMSSAKVPAAAVSVVRRADKLALPGKWDDELAHYIGWMLGDGCLTSDAAVTVYGNDDDKSAALPRHQKLLRNWTGFAAKPSIQANGTLQLRSGRQHVRDFLRALGVTEAKSPDKRVPLAIFEAPEDALIAFLEGIFDADGCVVNNVKKGTRYVGLGSKSQRLLRDVQELLASLGIASRIYETGTKKNAFSYTRKDGTHVIYGSPGKSYDLRITGRSLAEFAAHIHFTMESKKRRLTDLVDNHGYYNKRETVSLTSRESLGYAPTYNLTEPRNHTCVVSGIIVASCS